jgi:hypothetical protein
MSASHAIPRSALWLGIVGLLPFYACLILAMSDTGIVPSSIALHALTAYAAMILCFVGAIWWGIVVPVAPTPPSAFIFGFSVLGSLVGWLALLLPSPHGLALLTAGFFAQILADYVFAHKYPALFPTWLLHLRRGLTVGVLVALVIASSLVH